MSIFVLKNECIICCVLNYQCAPCPQIMLAFQMGIPSDDDDTIEFVYPKFWKEPGLE